MAHAQVDMRSVAACVSAVVTAYDDAAKLVERIKTTRQEPTDGPAMSSFEHSLLLGPPVVQGQYKQELQRHGDAYASGDPSAREDLKDIVINLQLSLLANLRMALLDDISLDLASLQAAADTSRLDAIQCLSQLGERMASSSPSPQNRGTPTPPAPRAGSQNQDRRPETPPRRDSSSRRQHSSGSDTVNGGQRSPISPRSYSAKRESPNTLDRSVSRETVTKSTDSLVPQPLTTTTTTTTNWTNQPNGPSSSEYNSADRTVNSNRSQSDQTNINGNSATGNSPQGSDQASSHDRPTANDGPQNGDQASIYGRPATSNRRQSSIQNSSYGHSVKSKRRQSNDQISSYDKPLARSTTSNSDQVSTFDHSVINSENHNHHPNLNRNQSLTILSPKAFIAELEGPPPPRPRSEPADDDTAGRQPEGNSVFVSADISSLLGPGPDPFGPEFTDPFQPRPSTGTPMGLPPGHTQFSPQSSQSVEVSTNRGKQNSYAGPSSVLSGLKVRARRLTQNPYENKARNLQVPRSLNLSGLKRGLGITSTNPASQPQAHNQNRSNTVGDMTYVTDLKPQLYLPSEENDYAGFCKGAWKMQNNVKKAFVLEIRPVGAYGKGYMWCCSKCTFELPPQKSSPVTATSPPPPPPPSEAAKRTRSTPSILQTTASWSTHPAQQILAHRHSRNFNPIPQSQSSNMPPDSTVTMSPNSNNSADGSGGGSSNSAAFDQSVHVHADTGIRYRQAFLAKSHAHSKAVPTSVSGTIASFGCIFCSSIAKSSAPLFGNVHSFMEHLISHAAEEGYTEGSGPAGGPQGGWYPDPNAGAVSYVPSTELLTRTKCVVGRVAADREDFDVNIPPKASDNTT